MKQKSVVGITLGDPSGIGPEVVMHALADERVRERIQPVVFGDKAVIEQVLSLTGLELEFKLGMVYDCYELRLVTVKPARWDLWHIDSAVCYVDEQECILEDAVFSCDPFTIMLKPFPVEINTTGTIFNFIMERFSMEAEERPFLFQVKFILDDPNAGLVLSNEGWEFYNRDTVYKNNKLKVNRSQWMEQYADFTYFDYCFCCS